MESSEAPYHAHIYYSDGERDAAAALRETFKSDANILFVGRMTDGPAGPHPAAQYEVHFMKAAFEAIKARIAETGLRARMHPLTDDDLADHTTLGQWIGEPFELDVSVLDPLGQNKGVPRFGVTDFD